MKTKQIQMFDEDGRRHLIKVPLHTVKVGGKTLTVIMIEDLQAAERRMEERQKNAQLSHLYGTSLLMKQS